MDKNYKDNLKVIVAILAATASNNFLEAAFPNRTEAELELDEMRRYIILLVRAIIIFYSIGYDWPLSMCIIISLFITIWIIVLRLSIGNEEES